MNYPNIITSPPGLKAREVIEKDARLLSPSFSRAYPLVISSGEGCIITDVDGNQYIDLNSGLACLNVGHGHPRVIEAIKSQAEKFLHYSYTDFYYEPVVSLSEDLCEIIPGDFEKRFFYGNSGAEAVEAAIKLARWHTKRQMIIAYIGSFHGRTMGALSLTASKPVQRRGFAPLIPGVEHIPYPYCYRCPFRLESPECGYYCVDYIDRYLFKRYVPPEDVALVIAEPIQGEGGYIMAPSGYFKELKKLLEGYNILFAVDEVQSGMGRTGRWLAIEHFGVIPDIVCLAKAIASGLPLGVMASRSEIMDWPPGSHASTFGGNPVSCAAAKAVIEVIRDEGLLMNAERMGEHLLKRLGEMKEEHELIGDVRGKGLMIGVELVRDLNTKEPAEKEIEDVILRCFRMGLAIVGCGASTLRIAPPLIINRQLIDRALEILDKAIREVEASHCK
ncbi:MAG: acetyl ornithine aminotransferase family protein [Candidatus Bathyarchaeia archaeon]|nr:acetyl ornithine aminotransferase family protein [Candidatus Bathyarchaeota archaeon]